MINLVICDLYRKISVISIKLLFYSIRIVDSRCLKNLQFAYDDETELKVVKIIEKKFAVILENSTTGFTPSTYELHTIHGHSSLSSKEKL